MTMEAVTYSDSAMKQKRTKKNKTNNSKIRRPLNIDTMVDRKGDRSAVIAASVCVCVCCLLFVVCCLLFVVCVCVLCLAHLEMNPY